MKCHLICSWSGPQASSLLLRDSSPASEQLEQGKLLSWKPNHAVVRLLPAETQGRGCQRGWSRQTLVNCGASSAGVLSSHPVGAWIGAGSRSGGGQGGRRATAVEGRYGSIWKQRLFPAVNQQFFLGLGKGGPLAPLEIESRLQGRPGVFGGIWNDRARVSPGGNNNKNTTTVSFQGQIFSYGIKVGGLWVVSDCQKHMDRFVLNWTENAFYGMFTCQRALVPGFLFYYTQLSLAFILLPFISRALVPFEFSHSTAFVNPHNDCWGGIVSIPSFTGEEAEAMTECWFGWGFIDGRCQT